MSSIFDQQQQSYKIHNHPVQMHHQHRQQKASNYHNSLLLPPQSHQGTASSKYAHHHINHPQKQKVSTYIDKQGNCESSMGMMMDSNHLYRNSASNSASLTNLQYSTCRHQQQSPNEYSVEEQGQDGLGPIIENEEELDDDKDRESSVFNKYWMFSEDFVMNGTPSRKHGLSHAEEIEFRRKGTTFIRDLTKFLKLNSICKETAYVYFHRFYMLRSFKKFEPIRIAMACLYFACKYEDHPVCKDYLIQVSYMLVKNIAGKQATKLSKDDRDYFEYCDRLIKDENYLLQVLGFELRVTHHQVLVVECYSKNPIPGTTQELYTSAYQIASELNRLTTLCLQYPAYFLASVSIYLAACYKMVMLPDDWCKTLIPDSEDLISTKKKVIKIGEQYKEILASSQLIRKILSPEYIRIHGVNTKCKQQDTSDQSKNTNSLLLSNFSPDSAYSSSSSTAAAYSPAEGNNGNNTNIQQIKPVPRIKVRQTQQQQTHHKNSIVNKKVDYSYKNNLKRPAPSDSSFNNGGQQKNDPFTFIDHDTAFQSINPALMNLPSSSIQQQRNSQASSSSLLVSNNHKKFKSSNIYQTAVNQQQQQQQQNPIDNSMYYYQYQQQASHYMHPQQQQCNPPEEYSPIRSMSLYDRI